MSHSTIQSKARSSVSRQLEKRTGGMALAITAGATADLLTTYYGIEHAGLYEANGTALWVLETFGWGGFTAMKLAASIAALSSLMIMGAIAQEYGTTAERKAARVSQWILTAVVSLGWFACAAWNLWLINGVTTA